MNGSNPEVIVTPELASGRAPRGNPDARDALLRAAQRLLARVGPSATIQDIVAEAGVGATYFYSYFENTTDLFAEAAEQAVGEFEERMIACTEPVPDLLDRFAARVRLFGRLVESDEMTARVIMLSHGQRIGRTGAGFRPGALRDLRRAIMARGLQCRDEVSFLLAVAGGIAVLMSDLLDEPRDVATEVDDFVATTFVALGLTAEEAFALSRQDLPEMPRTR